MTTCLGKSCSSGLLCVSQLNVNQFVCVSFIFLLTLGMGMEFRLLVPGLVFTLYIINKMFI